MRKEAILRYCMNIAAALSMAVFIITKSGVLMKAATEGMYDNGDLYRFAKVRDFKSALPAKECGEASASTLSPDSAEIILIGDSFIEACRGHKPLPALISELRHEKVYPVYAGGAPEYFDPLFFFWKFNINRSMKRIVVVECVERYLIDHFLERPSSDTAEYGKVALPEVHDRWQTIRSRFFVEAEKNYEIFFSSSRFTAPVAEFWNTMRFDLFGRISEETPVYSLAPPFLFYKEEVRPEMSTSFYYPHADSLVIRLAEHIASINKELQDRYNAEILFVPLPNAYTLYHKFLNVDPYDGFLPRLTKSLRDRGVAAVDIYSTFSSRPEILYLPTDTHWNAGGAHLAAEEISKALSRTYAR